MIIYCARNINNNKMYIGKTTKTMDERKAKHMLCAERNPVTMFHKSLAKGSEFEWFVLEHIQPNVDINFREKYWIEKLDTYKSGYNMTIGGDGGCTYQKGDEVHKRIWHKLSANVRGDKNPGANPEIHQRAQNTIIDNIKNKQYFKSGETHGNYKGKYVEKHQRYKGNAPTVNAKSVIIFDVEFTSLQSAARHYNICAETVANRCKKSTYIGWEFKK